MLWSSEEFGFCEVSDAWASGSSIMPQKKNPDAAELLRAKAPRVVAHLGALHGVMHGLPLTYNKDMQEDKEHLFDAVDTLDVCLQAAAGIWRTIAFDRERASAAASDQIIAATNVADLLVRRGIPSGSRTGSWPGSSARRWSRLARSPSCPEDLAQHPSARRRVLLRALPAARGWRARSPRAGRRWPGSASSSLMPVQSWTAERRSAAPLGATFFARPVLEVAKDMLGGVVRHGATAGVIVETRPTTTPRRPATPTSA